MKDHPLSPLLLAMLLIGLALPAPYLRGGNPSCANPSTPTQPPCPEEEPPTCPKCGEENPSTGSDSNNDFSTHTGTVFRRIVDLKMWGIIGEFGLKWERFGHSRFNPTARWFGHGHGWRHSFQWDVVEVTSNPDGSAKVVEVYDPSGRVDRYTLTGTAWVGAAANPAKLVQNGTSFTVEMRNAVRYRFERSIGDGGKPFYQLQDIRDSQGKLYQLFYDEQNRLVTVGAPHGGSLNVSYAEMEINRTDFTTIAQIPDAAPPAGQWSELLVNDPTPYRYLRYFGPDTADGAHAQVSEIEFYDENGVKIAGTPFGTSPAAGGGLDYAKAFDGNTSTSFKYLYRYYGFTGIDLGEGNAKRVSKVRYFPRAGFASQMKKGLFQGSTTAPQTVPVIARVDSSDGRAVIYRYTAMNDNLLATDWIVLEKVDYDEQGQRSAVYTYQQNWPATTPLLRTASDPNYRGAVKAVEYEYWKETNVHGMIRHEKNPVTGTTLASLDGVSSHTNKVIYPNGRTHTVEHNSLRTGFVSKRTDSLGRVTSFTYGAGGYGFLASKTDPLGRVTAYTRTSRGNLLTETLPDGSVRRWTRDALDRVLSHTDEHGHVTTYTRDAQGRATRIDYPDQSFEAFTYDPAFGLIATHTLRNGGVESFTYEDGLKTSHTDPLGNVTIFTYDAQRRLASVTDARGNTTTFAYGFDDKPTTTTYADGSSVINAYDAWGRRVSTTNELGNTWTYAHDEFGRVIAVTDPLGRTTRYSYAIGPAACGSCHADEKPTQITLPSGKIVKIDYDNEWRKVSETVGFGSGEAATTLYGYDAGNRLVTVTDPRGKVTTYTYDARDRRLSATDPLGNKTEWIHNDAAHTLTEKRPDGGLIVTQYDVMDRVASTTDPKGQTTQFAYGGTGAQGNKGDNLVMLTDARGNSYGFAYDLLNRKTTMIYPDNSQESWAYDLVGNMVTYTTRAGQVQTCTYDSRNRDTLCDWSDTTPDVSKSYDAAGRLLTMNSSVSHLTYTYDAANQLTSETQHIQGDGAAKTLSYTYDADGNRASLTYPGNTVATYTYTARNQLDTITYDGPPPLVDYTYDLNGNRTLKTIENGTSAIYTYDAANRLTSLDHRRGAESFARYDYTLNNVGNRTSRTETIHGTSTSDLYGYDPTDQVTQVRYNAAGAQHDRQVNYNYDPAGNRITVTDTAAQTPANYGTANNLNQYTVVDGGGLTYDANGNVTSHSGASYQYDAQNRLVSGTSRGNAFQFAYDPRDRCVKRTINGVVTFYTYDGWSLIQEYNVGDTEQKRYVHGAQIDEIIALINPFGTHFYHHDALGSVVGITAASGNMQEMYGYDIFGTPEIRDLTGLPIPQSALENRFMLTGREWIREVNLYDYRNRYYSSNLGRFLQTDPSRLRFTAVNLYRYVLNAPTMLDDPTGLEPIVLPPKPPIIKPPVTPKPPGPAALCVLAFEIGFAIGNAIGEGPAGDWLADQICECFTKDEEECRQRCYDQAERDYERCRQIPEWDTRARERCWRRAAEDLADCVHDC